MWPMIGEKVTLPSWLNITKMLKKNILKLTKTVFCNFKYGGNIHIYRYS